MALRWAASLVVALTTFSSIALAASPVNEFTSNKNSNSSGPSPTWQLGQQVTISWNADYDRVNLGFMAADDTDDYIRFYTGTASSTTWTVNVNKTDWSAANVVYYMVIADADNTDDGFYSEPVYVVAAGVSSAPTSATATTHSAPTSIAQQATTVFATVTQGPSSTTSATSTAQANSKGGNSSATAQDQSKLSSGTIAGIAVGAVAGVAALAAAVFFILRNRMLRQQLKNSEANVHAPYMPYDQLPPNAGGAAGAFGSPAVSKDAAGFGAAAAAGAAAGGAAGYYANEKRQPVYSDQPQEGMMMSELPTRSKTQVNRVSEMPAEPFSYSDQQGIQHEPVEIGGTELKRAMDENTPADSRPLMGEHPRDRTD